MDFSAWGLDEPNGNQTENCVAMTADHSFFWVDANCTAGAYQPICAIR